MTSARPLCLGTVLVLAIFAAAPSGAAVLENPSAGRLYSGIGVISGWKCEAGELTVRFNGGAPVPLLYGAERKDVLDAGACDHAHGGFVTIWNWGNLGDGDHTAIAYDNGEAFSRAQFTVGSTGEAFLQGVRLHLARTQALGSKCYFTAHGFLKALGRATGKRNHEWLGEALARLSATSVEITAARRTYFGSLIDGGVRDEDTGRYVVEINPKLAKFYGRTQWTQIDWQQRQQLRGKPLALWLHGFYATHAAPYPLTVAYLHKLSGSQTKRLRKFKENLTQALRDIEAIGAIKAFEIRDDLVHVWTIPSPSQQKHLAARRPPARRRK